MIRNNRSITINLQIPEGLKIIHDFKTGGAEKLGLGYAQLKAIKSDAPWPATTRAAPRPASPPCKAQTP